MAQIPMEMKVVMLLDALSEQANPKRYQGHKFPEPIQNFVNEVGTIGTPLREIIGPMYPNPYSVAN